MHLNCKLLGRRMQKVATFCQLTSENSINAFYSRKDKYRSAAYLWVAAEYFYNLLEKVFRGLFRVNYLTI